MMKRDTRLPITSNSQKRAPVYVPKPINCPKCRKSCNTQIALTTHLASCKVVIDPSLMQISKKLILDKKDPPETPMAKPELVKKGHVKPGEAFLWVKKQSSSKEEIWEKRKITTEEVKFDGLRISDIAKLGFEVKRKWFRKSNEAKRVHWMNGADYLIVDRSKLLETSIEGIMNCNLLKELKIVFTGEEKVNDAGGLLREWISLIVKELVKPELGLFVTTDSSEVSYTINSKAPNDDNTLKLYEFAGKVIGKALFDRISLDIHFDYCLLAAISGSALTLEDLRTLDTPLYNSLSFIKNNILKGCEMFEEHFVVPNGEEMIELCSLGSKILVTDTNKVRYINLIVDWYGRKRNQKKIDALMKGISTCLQTEKLSIFGREELEMLINGVSFIDVSDWEANTSYKLEHSKDSNVIKWFWKALRIMSQQDLSKLLKFCTGSTRTPVEGFRVLEGNRGDFARFCIQSTPLNKGRTLITADTCFNRLTIPCYADEETLIYELITIIQSDFDGVFGLD